MTTIPPASPCLDGAAQPLAAGVIVTEKISGWESTEARFHVITARTAFTVTLAQIPSTRLVEVSQVGGPTNYCGAVIPGPADAVIPGIPVIRKRIRIVDGRECIFRSGDRARFGSSFTRWDGRPVHVNRVD